MARRPVTDPHKAWNIKHFKRLESYNKRIEKMLNDAIGQAASLVGRYGGTATDEVPFTFSQNMVLKADVDNLLRELSEDISRFTLDAEGKEWEIAYAQATEYIGHLYNVAKQAQSLQDIFLDKQLEARSRSLDALNAFQNRKIGGMRLSGKVWNYTKDMEEQMEVAIDTALMSGRSAESLSRDIRSLLKDPNALFRRVRDENDQLRMSKAMAAYHPGQGRYRSAYMNAMRLARSEINMAYRSSDCETAQSLDCVVGIRINLSNNHTCNGVPFVDICDELQGDYPKDFKFTGWHPQCRCFITYINKTDEEFWRDLEDGVNRESVNSVDDVPENFKRWVGDNEERIAKADAKGTLPYFLRDNKEWYGENARRVQKPLSIQERADIRHSQRTKEQEDAIRKEWAERKAIRNYGRRILNYMDGISDVDTSALQQALRGGDMQAIMNEAKWLKSLGKTILGFDKLDDPMAVARATSVAEARKINEAVTRTLGGMPTELSSRKSKLLFEIDWMEREGSRRYPSTWKFSQGAYKKELAVVERELQVKQIEDSVLDALSYALTTHSKTFRDLADEMKAILSSKNFDLSEAKAKANALNDKYRQLLGNKAYYASKYGKTISSRGGETLTELKARLGKDMPKTLENLQDYIDDKLNGSGSIASYYRTLTDEEKARFKNFMMELFDNSDFGMNVPFTDRKGNDVLESLFKSHFKSQIETGTSKGASGIQMRKDASFDLFRTDGTTAAKGYEKYGFLMDKDILAQAHSGIAGQYWEYGDGIQVRFKKDKVLATFTMEDSLNSRLVPSLVTDPIMTSSCTGSNLERIVKGTYTNTKSAIQATYEVAYSYIELQYHGNLTLDCIESVFVLGKNLNRLSKGVLQKMQQYGITLYTERNGVLEVVDLAQLISTL